MKLLFCLAALLCLESTVDAQPRSMAKSRAALLKTSASSKLAWYSSSLKKLSARTGSASSGVLGTKTDAAGNKTEIGVGLTGSATGFTAQGATRQERSGSSTCTFQPTRVNYVSSDNFNLFLANTPIYPGQMFGINSVLTGSFASAATPARKQYQLGINIFNANNPGPNLLTVTDLTRSPLPEIQSTLLAPNYSAFIPAQGVFDMEEIQSSMALRAKFETSQGIFVPLQELGIPASVEAGIQASGNASSANTLKSYMVSFIQPMYTISVLTNHDQFFQTANAFSTQTASGYVESVTYGRRVSIIISSSSNINRVKAALSAALSADITATEAADIEVGSKASGETSVSLRSIAASFHASIYGGEGVYANAVFSDIVEFRDAFRTYINSASASRFSERTGALPLHYTIRRISDNGLLTVRSTGSFDELISCNTAKYKVEVLYEGFSVNNVVEVGFDDEEDIYGVLKLASISTNGRSSNKDLLLKSIPKSSAISKKTGGRDDDDVLKVAMSNVASDEVVGSILSFSQTMRDWEPAGEPAYKENSSAELKFNLSDKRQEILALTPGQSRTFANDIKLTEKSVMGESKITLHTKIRVTMN